MYFIKHIFKQFDFYEVFLFLCYNFNNNINKEEKNEKIYSRT